MNSFTLISADRAMEIVIDARIRIQPIEIPAPAPAPLVKLTATCAGITITHTGASAMSYTLPSDKQVRLQIAYTDANGNPAKVDGAVTWESSDETIAKIEPSTEAPSDPMVPEGGQVVLVPGAEIGNCQIAAKADADLGEGMRELVTLLDVTVVGGEAVAGTITPMGEPEPRP